MSFIPFVSSDQITAASLTSRFEAIAAEIAAVVSPVPVGAVNSVSQAATPSGWLACDGSAVSRTGFATLFAVIGTTFGVGDGSSTFNVPDLRGQTPIGDGTGVGLTARSVGQSLGEEQHQLSVAELASHTHTVVNTTTGTAGSAAGALQGLGGGGTSGPQGGNGFHNNMQPSLVLNWVIKS